LRRQRAIEETAEKVDHPLISIASDHDLRTDPQSSELLQTDNDVFCCDTPFFFRRVEHRVIAGQLRFHEESVEDFLLIGSEFIHGRYFLVGCRSAPGNSATSPERGVARSATNTIAYRYALIVPQFYLP